MASIGLSLFVGISDAICPSSNSTDESYEAHKQQLVSLNTCRLDHPRFECMEKQGALCDTMPTVFADCTKTFGDIYTEFLGTECDQDEVMCATAYNSVVADFCNPTGCPQSKDNFLDLFNTLGSCGYLAKAGGDPALESYEASSACLKQRGACDLDSANSILRYASCKVTSKQLLFDGDNSLELDLISELNDCYIKDFLPEDRCNAEFGFQVTNSYCPVEKKNVDEANDLTVIAIGAFVGAAGFGALLAIFLHYRKAPTVLLRDSLSGSDVGAVEPIKSTKLPAPLSGSISESDTGMDESANSIKIEEPLSGSMSGSDSGVPEFASSIDL